VISSFAIRVVTVATFFVGFVAGWWWRGLRDRELAARLLKAERERLTEVADEPENQKPELHCRRPLALEAERRYVEWRTPR